MHGDGDRRGLGSRPVSRRVLLAAGGAALVTGTVAAVTADGAGAPSRATARLATSRSPRPRSGALSPPQREQPRLPFGKAMDTIKDGPKVIALTIDDGPSPVYTPQILKILSQYRVTASFSMIGKSVAQFPAVAREVTAAGHMIVNHTWDHSDLGYLPAARVHEEITRATDTIHAATGTRPSMFRAPYGAWSTAVFRYCAQAGLTPLDWSVDPRDWSRPGAGSIVHDILADTRTGSIILEHDGGGDRSQTVAALKVWLPRLIAEGYQFTTP